MHIGGNSAHKGKCCILGKCGTLPELRHVGGMLPKLDRDSHNANAGCAEQIAATSPPVWCLKVA